jgi:hypothetical protein
MDMDNDNDDGEHETETDGAEVTDGHETGDLTASGSWCNSRRRSHTVMPPLVLDSKDGKTVIKPTGVMGEYLFMKFDVVLMYVSLLYLIVFIKCL